MRIFLRKRAVDGVLGVRGKVAAFVIYFLAPGRGPKLCRASEFFPTLWPPSPRPVFGIVPRLREIVRHYTHTHTFALGADTTIITYTTVYACARNVRISTGVCARSRLGYSPRTVVRVVCVSI